mgnify:CR=1 FL=1
MMKMTKPGKATCAAALAVLGLFIIPEVALAAADTGIMDSVMGRYQQAASAWGARMVSYGSWIFWGLALISMVWTYGMMILRKADIGEFFAETIRFFGTLGFFYWILLNGPAISDAVIKSMWMMGSAAAGGASSFTPSGITDIGFDIFFKALDESSTFSPVDSAAAIIISGCVLVVLALVAVNMLLLFVSAWILMYGGVVLLGFGGYRWTSDIAITYYKTVLGIGVQLMGMVLLVGIGKTFIDQAYAGMSEGINLKELGVLGITAVVLLYLTNKIPPMLAGIVGGASTGGVGGFGAGAAMGAAVAAAGIAAGAASAGASMALGGACEGGTCARAGDAHTPSVPNVQKSPRRVPRGAPRAARTAARQAAVHPGTSAGVGERTGEFVRLRRAPRPRASCGGALRAGPCGPPCAACAAWPPARARRSRPSGRAARWRAPRRPRGRSGRSGGRSPPPARARQS